MKGSKILARRSGEARDERVRVTLDLSPNGYKRLQKLVAVTNTSSATVLRQALQLYEFVVEKTAQGNTFKTVDEAGHEQSIAFLGYND